jgi:phosphatidylserine/phosphatidylglycerophosphate/cardiolipin synthase-like enzyme
MSTFATPIVHGTVLTRVTPSSPAPDLRFNKDPLMWIGVPANTVISAFATGVIARAQGASNGIPNKNAAAWTLFQLSPLPAMSAGSFKKILGGLPVQLVLVETAGANPAQDDLVLAGSMLTTAPATGAFLAFAFQDRLCRDPLTWAEAIGASGDCDSNWSQFITDLAGLSNARNLRVLDHRGAPINSPPKTMGPNNVTVSIDGGAPVVVPLVAGMDGDTGQSVGAASSATIKYTSGVLPIVASGVDDNAPPAFGGVALQLEQGARMAQILDADQWLATPEMGLNVKPWRADSLVEPIQEGTPYFTDLVAEFGKAKPNGKVQLAGWGFVKGSQADDTVEWPLVPGDPSTTILKLINDLVSNNVEVHMLVNKLTQFDSAVLDDFNELGAILFGLWASLMPLQALLRIQTDPAGYAAGLVALAAGEMLLSSNFPLDEIKKKLEVSQPFMDAVSSIHNTVGDPTIATWTKYEAAFADNPLVTPPPFQLTVFDGPHTIDDISHVGVYHQKYAIVQRSGGDLVAYLGGIDINSDRPDTTIHRAIHPFHDVQVKITGPAVIDVICSYQERAAHHKAPLGIPPPGSIPAAGSHLVQIARTYFKPGTASSTTPLEFAPQGETTPIRTLERAIRQARDFIYIEDQYFTPPDDYVQALIDAAANDVRALMITMPYQNDQPYGGDRRADVLNELQKHWKARLFAGTPVRRYLHATPALTTNLGRMRLANDLPGVGASADLSPLAHIPPPPFWAFIGNELVLFYAPIGGPSGTGASAFQSMLMSRAAPGTWGAKPVAHPKGAPVMAVQVPGIYVHAKVMIVDDVFLFAGSSNINRRGLYHDGEMNCFTIPEHLKGDPKNPARLLRSRLMAEHAGLTPEMGQSLFADPISAITYFTSRSWYQGAPRQSLNFFGSLPPEVGLGTSDTIGGLLLAQLIPTSLAVAKHSMWPLLVDPTTSLDPSSAKGPEYP